MDGEALIRDYLDRLDALARKRTPDQADGIVAGVREHVEAALVEAGRRDEASVRTVLDGLGSPEAIVAAGRSDEEPGGAEAATVAARRAAGRPSVGPLEIVALLLITFGGVLLPFVGPLLGVALTWWSRRWTLPVKIGATAIAVVLLALPLGLLAVSTGSMTPSAIPIASPH